MIERLADALGAIIPTTDESPRALRRWRVSVALWLMGVTGFGAFHVAWACGWLPGMPGFALEVDLARVQADVHRSLVMQYRTSLFEVRQQQCEAARAGRPLSAYTSKLQDLLDEYDTLTDQDYRLPACSEL